MKTISDLTDFEMRELKIRYLEMLESEGCLNEVVFGLSEWDDDDEHTLQRYRVDQLIDMIPDDVIVSQWEGECFSKEDFAA